MSPPITRQPNVCIRDLNVVTAHGDQEDISLSRENISSPSIKLRLRPSNGNQAFASDFSSLVKWIPFAGIVFVGAGVDGAMALEEATNKSVAKTSLY